MAAFVLHLPAGFIRQEFQVTGLRVERISQMTHGPNDSSILNVIVLVQGKPLCGDVPRQRCYHCASSLRVELCLPQCGQVLQHLHCLRAFTPERSTKTGCIPSLESGTLNHPSVICASGTRDGCLHRPMRGGMRPTSALPVSKRPRGVTRMRIAYSSTYGSPEISPERRCRCLSGFMGGAIKLVLRTTEDPLR